MLKVVSANSSGQQFGLPASLGFGVKWFLRYISVHILRGELILPPLLLETEVSTTAVLWLVAS